VSKQRGTSGVALAYGAGLVVVGAGVVGVVGVAGVVAVVGTVSTVERSGSSFSPQPAARASAATAASAAAHRLPALRFVIGVNVSDRAFSAGAGAGIADIWTNG
jgi:Na+-transporting methylmalonyl-CoA/oxaloacetate decarboxylase gamma subunit